MSVLRSGDAGCRRARRAAGRGRVAASPRKRLGDAACSSGRKAFTPTCGRLAWLVGTRLVIEDPSSFGLQRPPLVIMAAAPWVSATSPLAVSDSTAMSWKVYSDVIVDTSGEGKARPVSDRVDFQLALGAAVACRRRELGLTQEQLSLASDLHQRWISNVETGVRNPSYASLRRLAEGLGLATSELIRRAEAVDNADRDSNGAAGRDG
jgi:DNA-binding XRE family transcriptional regulator